MQGPYTLKCHTSWRHFKLDLTKSACESIRKILYFFLLPCPSQLNLGDSDDEDDWLLEAEGYDITLPILPGGKNATPILPGGKNATPSKRENLISPVKLLPSSELTKPPVANKTPSIVTSRREASKTSAGVTSSTVTHPKVTHQKVPPFGTRTVNVKPTKMPCARAGGILRGARPNTGKANLISPSKVTLL